MVCESLLDFRGRNHPRQQSFERVIALLLAADGRKPTGDPVVDSHQITIINDSISGTEIVAWLERALELSF